MSEEKTNFLQITELLKAYHPAQRGIISGAEIKLVSEALNIEQRSILDLRNLRDFVVMYVDISRKDDGISYHQISEDIDRLSAITSVIDEQIIKLGGEV